MDTAASNRGTSQITDITTDGTYLYVVEGGGNKVRKVVIATGEVTTLAGPPNGYADGVGASALFSEPGGITTDGKSLFVSDSNNPVALRFFFSRSVHDGCALSNGRQ